MDNVDAMPMEGMGKYKPRKGSRASLDDSGASVVEGSSSTMQFSTIKEDQEAEREQATEQAPKTITRHETQHAKSIFAFLDNIPPRFKLLVSFLLHAFSLGLAISAFFVWTSPSIQYADLADNWEAVPITDIQLIAAGSSCPADFSLVESSFFGVDTTCDCGPNNIKLLPCTVVDANAGCRSVRFLGPFNLPLWRNYGICIQRHVNGTAVSAANRRANCNKPGWTTCTSTTGDDPICVPDNTPCPLTRFSVVYGGPGLCPAGTTATLAIPSSSEPRYLCTSREGSYPLIDLEINVGGRCLQSSSFNPYSQQNPHQGISSLSVDVSTPPFPCGDSNLDTRYHDIEMRLMGSLFNDNLGTFSSLGVDSSDISYWTQLTYPVFYKFQVRGELFFEKTCPFTRQEVIEAERELELVSSAQTGLVLVSIISSLLIDFPWIVWSCTVGIKKYRQKTATFLVKAILTILTKVISASLIAVTFYSIWEIRLLIDGLTKAHCGDQPTNDLFSHYNSEMTTTLWMDIVVFIWNIVTIILQIRSMIVLPTGKQNPKKEFATKPTEIELHQPRRTDFQGGDEDAGQSRFASRFTYSKGDIPALDQLGSHRSFEPVSSVDDLSQAASRKSTQSFHM